MMKYLPLPRLFLVFFILGCSSSNGSDYSLEENTDSELFITRIVDPKQSDLRLFWKDDEDTILQSFSRLKTHIENGDKQLKFAMNGGMFQKDFSPQGLYIEDSKMLAPLLHDTSGYGNFYMQPNGVFVISESGFTVVKTQEFKPTIEVKYATQSGPLLIHKGTINSHFGVNSTSFYIRNGIGILPNGRALFAISKKPVNFYTFAQFFHKNGCQNALYLDGYVSRIYLPDKQIEQNDGRFGVMIAEISD